MSLGCIFMHTKYHRMLRFKRKPFETTNKHFVSYDLVAAIFERITNIRAQSLSTSSVVVACLLRFCLFCVCACACDFAMAITGASFDPKGNCSNINFGCNAKRSGKKSFIYYWFDLHEEKKRKEKIKLRRRCESFGWAFFNVCPP